MTVVQTMEQARSREAFDNVESVKGQPYKKEYRSRAREFPSMVLANGLLQTMSFLFSKSDKDKGCKNIAEHIRGWIKSAIEREWLEQPVQPYSVKDVSETIKWLSSLDIRSYLAVTNEVMSFSPWLKRFAEGMIEK